jgi:hypothetical protein
MQQFVGKDAALQLQTIIQNASISDKGSLAAAIVSYYNIVIGRNGCFCRNTGLDKYDLGIQSQTKKRIVEDNTQSLFYLFLLLLVLDSYY